MHGSLLEHCKRVNGEYEEHLAQMGGRMETPHASIVIPAWRESPGIVSTIQSAVTSVRFAASGHITEPIVTEVLVVNNDSQHLDDTAECVERCGVRLVEEPTKGVSHARQRGNDAANGSIIMGSDGDTLVPEGWVVSNMKEYENKDVVGVTGPFLYDKVHWLMHCYSAARVPWRQMKSVVRHLTGRKKNISLTGANFSYRKDIAEAAGGFELGSNRGEDTIFGQHMSQHGVLVFNGEPSNTVHTSGRRYRTFQRAVKQLTRDLVSVLRVHCTNLPTPRHVQFEDYRD